MFERELSRFFLSTVKEKIKNSTFRKKICQQKIVAKEGEGFHAPPPQLMDFSFGDSSCFSYRSSYGGF